MAQQQHHSQAPEPQQQSPEWAHQRQQQQQQEQQQQEQQKEQQQQQQQQQQLQQQQQQLHSSTIDQRIAQVLRTRVDRILLVLENVTDNKNYLAILRTCDVLGVQRVWVIHSTTPLPADAPEQGATAQHRLAQGRKKGRIARASSSWLEVRHFASTADAVGALRAGGWTIWATDLSPGALSLADPAGLQLPYQLAVVVGTESSGISSEMRDAADRCVFLPMFGFTESLNVGVASALVLQSLIAADPGIRGQLLGEGRAQQLADKWRAAAGRGAPQTWAGATVTHAEGRVQSQQQQQQQQQSLSSSLAQQLQLDS